MCLFLVFAVCVNSRNTVEIITAIKVMPLPWFVCLLLVCLLVGLLKKVMNEFFGRYRPVTKRYHVICYWPKGGDALQIER